MADALIPITEVRAPSASLPVFFRCRAGASAGVVLLAVAASALLHRWSIASFMFVLALSFLAARLCSHSWRLAHRAVADPPAPAKCLDLAILSWGISSLIAALDAPSRAGDMLSGNLVGFETPAATLLGWFPLALGLAAVLSRPLVTAAVVRRRWLLGVVAVTIVALIGEAGARLWAVAQPRVQGFPTHRTAMWLHRYATVNPGGFRKTEKSAPAGLGARRLLVIGDSYAFGWGIERASDRISERLLADLDTATGVHWDLYDVSRPGLDTRQQVDLVRGLPPVHPDVAVILYRFNDIAYLSPGTERPVVTEEARGLLDPVNPGRLLFRNSFLSQEAYVRARRLWLEVRKPHVRNSPADRAVVERHLRDLCRLVRLASDDHTVVAVVPLDIGTAFSRAHRERIATFTKQAREAGIPVWRVDSAFVGHEFNELRVNPLDDHPNELAHGLAEAALAQHIVPILWGATPKPKVSCNY
ncbi:MAG: hypothetical protein HY700_09190 [Gemmatimonadetes bacterium]|nr:hypothetical protein [Gemmatimonadota bacterium]